MPLAERILADLKTALLAHDSVAATTLRGLKSELKNAEIAQGSELSEEASWQVIRRELKKRTEAVEILRKNGSPERAEQEMAEAAILEKYLPAQIDIALVEQYIQGLITENSQLQKGDLIRQTLSHFQGQTDGRTVSELVAKHLQ